MTPPLTDPPRFAGHGGYCHECASRWVADKRVCPACRQKALVVCVARMASEDPGAPGAH